MKESERGEKKNRDKFLRGKIRKGEISKNGNCVKDQESCLQSI